MEYIRETDRAVCLKLVVEDYDTEQTRAAQVWVPKSQLSTFGVPGMWITEQKVADLYGNPRSASQYEARWESADGSLHAPELTEREAQAAEKRATRIAQGVSSYNDLMAKAKAAGVKGIRKGM
jgi:hypothetical protein